MHSFQPEENYILCHWMNLSTSYEFSKIFLYRCMIKKIIYQFLILIPFALKSQNSVTFYIIIFVFIKYFLVEVVVVIVIIKV